MMRVGVLRGGLEVESEKAIPPSQRLQMIRGQALARLKAEASDGTLHHNERLTAIGDNQWERLNRGLPSPPTSNVNSDDEISSIGGTES
jgi:stearoyl-CoA desaturase (delta-9 desaturase)